MPRPTPLTLRKKQSITAASAIIIVVCGSLLLWQAHRARESARRIDHTNHVLRTADEILLRLVDAETGQRGYLISGAPRFLAPYGGARADVARELRSVVPIVMLTGYGDEQVAVEIMQAGASDYIPRARSPRTVWRGVWVTCGGCGRPG